MKKLLIIITTLLCLNASGQQASFDNFEYKGHDTYMADQAPKDAIANPLLFGFYPDPSICRKGDDYYMVNSSFSYFPSIPIFHSKNLKDWKQIGHVLDRPGQVELKGLDLSNGVYAPDISYNPYNETFYVINTIVGGIGNYFVKTTNPQKGWSDPVKLPKVIGIDPSIFYDDDGKAYIFSSHLPPKSEWNGHRAIYLYEFDYEKEETSEPILVIDGGFNRANKPKWLEGPHLYKKDGKYYMIMAEGGTHSGHREVAFFSNNIKGPYEPCPINPILSQLELPEDRPDKVINVGHADMVQTKDGKWYSVFLGCRPYSGKLYNTGRETFILPVTWTDNSPVILAEGEPVPNLVTKDIIWKDKFSYSKLDYAWNGIRSLDNKWVNIDHGKLNLKPLSTTLGDKTDVAFIGRRQQNLAFTSAIDIDFTPKAENEFAGMVLLQNENNYISVGITSIDGTPHIISQRIEGGKVTILSAIPLKTTVGLKLHIDADGGTATTAYTINGAKHILASDIDITHLSTDKAKGFVGCYIGMYATSAFPKLPVSIYVSPDGSDTATGDYSSPLATVEKALQKGLPYLGKRKVDIIFKDGIYYLPKPIYITDQYSASEVSPPTQDSRRSCRQP